MREMELSAYVKLMDRYRVWKAQQPPRELPDSHGPTAENIAYLKEHYSGELSWEERVDALETMKQMGVITQDQRNAAMGGGLVCVDLTKDDLGDVISANMRSFSQDLDTYFCKEPIGSFKTADDLFSWLDNLLESES